MVGRMTWNWETNDPGPGCETGWKIRIYKTEWCIPNMAVNRSTKLSLLLFCESQQIFILLKEYTNVIESTNVISNFKESVFFFSGARVEREKRFKFEGC